MEISDRFNFSENLYKYSDKENIPPMGRKDVAREGVELRTNS